VEECRFDVGHSHSLKTDQKLINSARNVGFVLLDKLEVDNVPGRTSMKPSCARIIVRCAKDFVWAYVKLMECINSVNSVVLYLTATVIIEIRSLKTRFFKNSRIATSAVMQENFLRYFRVTGK